MGRSFSVVMLITFTILIAAAAVAIVLLRPSAHAQKVERMYGNHPYDVSVSFPAPVVSRTDATAVQISVSDAGQPVDLLLASIPLHVTIIDASLNDVSHYTGGDDVTEVEVGVYEITHHFSEPGAYTIWIELNTNETRDHHGHGKSDYVGRVNVPAISEDVTPQRAVSRDYQDQGYTAEIDSPPLVAGAPGRVSLAVKQPDGTQSQLLENVDDWYVITNQRLGYYNLHHFDQEISDSVHRITPEIQLDVPGTYALWARTYTNAGSLETGPAFGDELTLQFVINVVPN